jgi:cytoskeletal protein RodZ
MKKSKTILIAIATVAVLTGTGVAAAYSDIRIIPAGPRAVHNWAEPAKEEPASEPVSEAENSDTSFTASPENDSPVVSSPNIQTQTPASEETSNEPAPEVEADPTPEPLPAPDTSPIYVENPNNVLGNDTAGNVSHN